jgi:hypothetical protein
VTLDGSDEQYLYHAPCHDPIKSNDSATVIAKIMNSHAWVDVATKN